MELKDILSKCDHTLLSQTASVAMKHLAAVVS